MTYKFVDLFAGCGGLSLGLQQAGFTPWFVNEIVERRIFDGEKLYDLIAPLELGWKDRARKEEELMKDLIPLLKRIAGGQKISGLSAYED